MAKIGLRDPYYAVVTVTTGTGGAEEESIGTAKRLAKAVQLQTTVNAPTTKLYADDGAAESINEFIDGSGTLTVDELEDDAEVDLYNATKIATANDIVNKATDTSAYVRFGYVIRRIKGGVTAYRGIVLARVQFVIPSEQWDTKGEQIVLNTTQLPFNFYRDIREVWRRRSPWQNTYAAAQTWMLAKIVQADLTVAGT